jgi:hypothetical protein
MSAQRASSLAAQRYRSPCPSPVCASRRAPVICFHRRGRLTDAAFRRLDADKPSVWKTNMEHVHEPDRDARAKSRSTTALIVLIIIAAVFLVTEHRAHLIGWIPYWPYLLLLACPLMHLFMHGGHSHGRHGASGKSDQSAGSKK